MTAQVQSPSAHYRTPNGTAPKRCTCASCLQPIEAGEPVRYWFDTRNVLSGNRYGSGGWTTKRVRVASHTYDCVGARYEAHQAEQADGLAAFIEEMIAEHPEKGGEWVEKSRRQQAEARARAEEHRANAIALKTA